MRRLRAKLPSLEAAHDEIETRISANELNALIGTARCPLIVDVRREAAFEAEPTRIAGAVWHDHMSAGQLPLRPGNHRLLRPRPQCQRDRRGKAAAGGREACGCLRAALRRFAAAGRAAGEERRERCRGASGAPSVWVTRERPKIDRIACPWLIRRFIDPFAAVPFRRR